MEFVNNLPVAGLAIGYTAGIITNEIAIAQAAKQEKAGVSSWSNAIAESEAKKDNEPAFWDKTRRIAGRTIAVLALTGALVGGLTELAINSDMPRQSAPSALDIVVDHSGATTQPSNNPNTSIYTQVNEFADQFSNDNKSTIKYFFSNTGNEGFTTDIAKVNQDSPGGDALMPQITKDAIDDTLIAKAVSSDKKETTNGTAILVLTNGDAIGSVGDVVSQAKTHGTTAIDVVNFGGNNPDLETIAEQTGGTYWDVNKTNPATVANKIESDLANRTTPKTELNPDILALNVLAGLGILTVVQLYRNRRRMVFETNPEGQ